MGLGINRGYGEYNAPVPKINLRSVSARRAALIKWHKQHPHSFKLFQKAELQLEKSHEKLRSCNEIIYSLEKRINSASSRSKKTALTGSLARVYGLKADAVREIARQSHARDRLAQHLYDWRETLPLLDGQIAEARQPR